MPLHIPPNVKQAVEKYGWTEVVGRLTVPCPAVGLNSPLQGQHVTGTIVDEVPLIKGRKQTAFELAMHSLQAQTINETEGYDHVEWYYTPLPTDVVVEALGWWNPLREGKPRSLAKTLLDGLPSPVAGKMARWKMASLMYLTPPVVGRRASRNRTSTQGVALLKHWAKTFPAFEKFFDCYWSEGAEKEIAIDCIDMTLGTIPTRFKIQTLTNQRLRDKLLQEKLKQEVLARQMMNAQAMSQGQYLNGLGSADYANQGLGAGQSSQLSATALSMKQQAVASRRQMMEAQAQHHLSDAMKYQMMVEEHEKKRMLLAMQAKAAPPKVIGKLKPWDCP